MDKKELKTGSIISVTITGTITKEFKGVSVKFYTTNENIFIKVDGTNYTIGSAHNIIINELEINGKLVQFASFI